MQRDIGFALRGEDISPNKSIAPYLCLTVIHFESRLASVSKVKCYHILLFQLLQATLHNKASSGAILCHTDLCAQKKKKPDQN